MIDYKHQPSESHIKPAPTMNRDTESRIRELENRVQKQSDLIERLQKHINKLLQVLRR